MAPTLKERNITAFELWRFSHGYVTVREELRIS